MRPLSPVALRQCRKAKNISRSLNYDIFKRNFPECLFEWDDEEFVIINVEKHLGIDPVDVGLWTSYLRYFKAKNDPRILNVYSRFCRLFIENNKMREQYRNEIKRIKNINISLDVTKWWIDCIEFERVFVSLESAKNLLKFVAINYEVSFSLYF